MRTKISGTQTGGRAATTGVIPGDYSLSVGNPMTPTPSGWSWVPLSDLARLESGHTPSRKHPEYWDGEVPWIGITDATANDGRTIFDTNQHTNMLGISNSSARILPKNTVCLSRTASVGYVIVMGREMATSQDFVNWICEPSRLDFNFLKYVLLAEKRSFLRFAHGTTHQTIYFPEVKAFHVCVPPLSEQKAIAHILGSLDDKIELNRKQNATLEAMAQALFQSWFVDFDPVIDKALAAGNEIPEPLQSRAARRAALANRRKPLPAEIEGLFPDRFVETEEMGWVPEGWGVGKLGDVFSLVMGQSPLGADLNDLGEGIPFFQGKTDFGFRFPTNRIYCENPPRIAAIGDTLVSVRAPVGSTNLAATKCGIGRGVAAIRHQSESRSYTYYSMQFLSNIFAKFDGEGTVFGSINKNDFAQISILLPSSELINLFEKRSFPLDELIAKNSSESTTLTQLRDTLLPKLISGEIRVGDVENLIS